MNLPKPVRAIFCWATITLLLAGLCFSGMITYDFYQYKSAFLDRQTAEIRTLESNIESTRQSVKGLGHLIAERILAAKGHSGTIQSILSSSSYLASLEGLPTVKSADFAPTQNPSQRITRFGIQERNGSEHGLGLNSITVGRDDFSVTIEVEADSQAIGILQIGFDNDVFNKQLGPFSTLSINSREHSSKGRNYKGFRYYSLPPIDFGKFALDRSVRYSSLLFFISLIFCSAIFLYIILKRQFKYIHEKQISSLKESLQELIESEYKNQNYRAGQDALRKTRSLLVKRQQQQLQHIQAAMKHLEQTSNDPALSLDQPEKTFLFHSCESSLGTILRGGCAPIISEEFDLSGLINSVEEIFSERIQANEIAVINVEQQTMLVKGDRVFLLFVLSNMMGKAIYRCQPLGEVRIKYWDDEAHTTIEILDSGAVTSQSLENMITESHELFVDSNDLKEMCGQAGIDISTERIEGGNLLKFTLPNEPTQELPDNVVPLFS